MFLPILPVKCFSWNCVLKSHMAPLDFSRSKRTCVSDVEQHGHEDVVHQVQSDTVSKKSVPHHQQVLERKLSAEQQTHPPAAGETAEVGNGSHDKRSARQALDGGWRYWHAIDLGRNLQPVEVHVQLSVMLFYQQVLDAVDFGHNGDRRPGVLGPREWNARHHLLFTLQEDIIHVTLLYGHLTWQPFTLLRYDYRKCEVS